MNARILLIEDDQRLRTVLRATFMARDYAILEAATGEVGVAMVASERPDLVILDLKLPGIDGLEALRQIRTFSDAPVVVLTVRDALEDKVQALSHGADDYVLKPFEPDELLARVSANLRRTSSHVGDATLYQADDLVVDLALRSVTRGDTRITLTPLEYRLLEVLLSNQGRLLTREELVGAVWHSNRSDQPTRLRATVVSLRRKLGDDAGNPRYIFTEPGLGYRWIAPHERSGSTT